MTRPRKRISLLHWSDGSHVNEDAEEADEDLEEAKEDVEDADKIDLEHTSKSVVPILKNVLFVRPPKQLHRSWDDWLKYLDNYSRDTFQVIRACETVSVAARNSIIKNKNLQVPLVPEDFGSYQRLFICTHGWKRKSRGTGVCPRQRILFTNCKFRFMVQVNQLSNGSWMLVVKNAAFQHNHTIQGNQYEGYRCARGVKDPANATQVETMPAAGAKRAKIYDFLLSSHENVTRRDVDNIVQAFREKNRDENDDDTTGQELMTLAAENEGTAVTVDENAKGETGVISITTKHMR